MPILRDPDLEARERLKIIGLPTTFFIDAKGMLQDCIVGDSPLAAATTTRKLEKLLAGEVLAGQTMEEFQQRLKEYEKEVDLQFSGEAQTATVQQAKPTPPAAKSEPKKFHLASLWKCTAIQSGRETSLSRGNRWKAANLRDRRLQGDYRDRLGWQGCSNHKANLADEEIFTLLRTAAGSDGKRYFVAFAPWQQRFHLFDENFKHLLSYPDSALENRNTGLTTSNWAI